MHSSTSCNMHLRNEPMRRAWLLAGMALAGLALSPAARAAQITFEMRAVSTGVLNGEVTSPGVEISADGHSVTAPNPGSVIVLQLFAIVGNTDGNHVTDGFHQVYGSFLATGTLAGGIRGDTNFVQNGQTRQNNVPGFLGVGTQAGFVFDLNGDGALDVGNLANHGSTTNPAPWFVAVGGNGDLQTVVGVGAGVDATSFMIGETTFTLGPNIIPLPFAAVNFRLREFTSGLNSNYVRFRQDGTDFTLLWNDPQVSVGADVLILIDIPEPSAIGMLMLGTLGLVGFRRSAFRRLSA
jgi:hypothetical protein